MDKFVLTEHQQKIVDEANKKAEYDAIYGRPAPEELVKRMTEEQKGVTVDRRTQK